MVLVKATTVIFLIIILEICNGILRMRFLTPKFKNHLAKQISTVIGCTIIFVLSLLTVEWIGITTQLMAISLGIFWMIVMFLFEVLFGKFVFKMSWKKIFDDFNLVKGNLLLIGMIFLALAPFLAWKTISLF